MKENVNVDKLEVQYVLVCVINWIENEGDALSLGSIRKGSGRTIDIDSHDKSGNSVSKFYILEKLIRDDSVLVKIDNVLPKGERFKNKNGRNLVPG